MQNEELRTENSEISMKDIVDFHKRNKRQIAFGGIAGLLLSLAYVLLAPNKYEANWQMKMAQYVSNSNVNSEEPAALIQRLRLPTAYTEKVKQSCGVHVDGNINDYLNGILKIDALKNVPNSVEMKIRVASTEQAKQCAEAVVAMIVEQQRSLIDEHLAGRQVQLAQYQQALQAEQQQLKTIKKEELGNFGYLARLDKFSWLRTRIDALQEEALLSQKHPAKLISPIYVKGKPVSPKVGISLLLGALLGLMLGVVYALGREGLRKAD